MLFYITLAILFLLLSFWESSGSVTIKAARIQYTKKNLMFWLLYAILLFVTVCRSKTVGGDLRNYEETFKLFAGVPWQKFHSYLNYDLGYYGLSWLVGQFTKDFYVLISLVSVISVTLFMQAVKEQSRCMSLSVFVYICLGNLSGLFSGLRQELAVIIIFYGIKYLKKRRFIQYFFIVLIAGAFHSTAIVGMLGLAFVFTTGNRSGYIKYLVMLSGVILVTAFGIPFLIQNYTANNYSSEIIAGQGWKLFLFFIGLFGLLMLKYKIMIQSNKENLIYYNFCRLGIVIQMLSFGFSLLTRLSSYFMIALIILIPNIGDEIRDRKSKAIFFTIMITAISALYLYYLYRDMSGIVPYHFRWKEPN